MLGLKELGNGVGPGVGGGGFHFWPHHARNLQRLWLVQKGWEGKTLIRKDTRRRGKKKQRNYRTLRKAKDEHESGQRNKVRNRTATHHGIQEAPLQGIESGHGHTPCSSPFIIEDLLLLPFIIEVLTGHHLQGSQRWYQKRSHPAPGSPGPRRGGGVLPWRSGTSQRTTRAVGSLGFDGGAVQCTPEQAS